MWDNHEARQQRRKTAEKGGKRLLASRSRELLKVLINTRHLVRIKDLARDFQVSERTIKYDLKSVRRWLTDQNVSLYSQPNKGIWIAEGSGKRSELLAALADAGPREIYLNQRARFQHIVLELLFCDGYLRIGELAQNLQVSRNTVVADLREAEAYLESWGLFLQRKAHYGILVSGSEWKRRLALENVIQTSLGSHDMYRLMQALLGETDQPLCPAAILRHFAFSAAEEQQIQRTMRRLLERLQRELEICLSERVLISVLIRLSISLYRLRKRHKLQAKPLPFCHDKAQQIYRVFQQELSRLGAQCGMLLPEAEMVFVCLPAMGTTLLADDSADGGEPKQLDDYALTSELIEAISLRTGMPLRDDPDLAVDLLAHLSDRIRKHLNGVLDPNPLADEIKRA